MALFTWSSIFQIDSYTTYSDILLPLEKYYYSILQNLIQYPHYRFFCIQYNQAIHDPFLFEYLKLPNPNQDHLIVLVQTNDLQSEIGGWILNILCVHAKFCSKKIVKIGNFNWLFWIYKTANLDSVKCNNDFNLINYQQYSNITLLKEYVITSSAKFLSDFWSRCFSIPRNKPSTMFLCSTTSILPNVSLRSKFLICAPLWENALEIKSKWNFSEIFKWKSLYHTWSFQELNYVPF